MSCVTVVCFATRSVDFLSYSSGLAFPWPTTCYTMSVNKLPRRLHERDNEKWILMVILIHHISAILYEKIILFENFMVTNAIFESRV